MIICGMEKYSMVDYPDKIACTIFTLACNFRCPFCQNSALVIPGMNTDRFSEDEVLDYLNKRKKMIDALCITGGEPTLQHDLVDFIRRVKRETGLLVKLDSNGTNPKVIQSLLDEHLIDYIAMDIKNSPEKYSGITATDNINMDDVRESVEIIKSSGIEYEFRTTLVSEYHTAEDMEEIGKWISGAKRYKLQKFEDRGNNIQGGLTAVPPETAMEFLEIIKGYVPDASLRNYD